MKIKGTITKLVSDEDIESKKDSKIYVKRVFLLEVDEKGDGKYVDSIAMEAFGNVNNRLPEIRIGDKVEVTFSIKSREWKGRYFTQTSVIFMDILKMKPGGDYYGSGGTRTELFNTDGEANKGGETEKEYYARIEKEQKSNEKSDDLPF